MTATALFVAQTPLVISLAILALVAAGQGTGDLWLGSIRFTLVLASAASAATPVLRQWITTPLALSALAIASGSIRWMPLALPVLVLADLASGPLRRDRRRSDFWSVPGFLVNFWIAWRALQWRILPPYGAALFAWGVTLIFLENNALPATLEAGATAFGACFTVTLFFSRMGQKLAVRRPAWHFARSLPWSSSSRILADAVLMSTHSAPILIWIGLVDLRALLMVLAALPYLALRIAGYIRIIPENRVAAGMFLLEGFVVSSSLALLPWTSLLWMAGSVPAYLAARTREQYQKVSRWRELHHAAAGDTLIWSE